MAHAWDECECGHEREEHGRDGCEATASSGYCCSCPSFALADGDDDTDPGDLDGDAASALESVYGPND